MYIYLDAPLLNTQLFFIHPFFDLPFIHFLKQIVSLYCSFLFIHIFIDFLLYFFLYLLPSSSLSLSLYLPNKQPYYNNTALDAVSLFSSDPLIFESTSPHPSITITPPLFLQRNQPKRINVVPRPQTPQNRLLPGQKAPRRQKATTAAAAKRSQHHLD